MLKRRLFWLVAWGVAFGFIEASIVVYLRKIYYPAGFSFPAVIIEPEIAVVEMIREITTLVFMWAVAELSYRSFQCRLAVFMFLFGIWDIFYYVFLKATLDWPSSPADWDILFLVPLPWVGPVWAPVVVSAGMIWAGTVIMVRNEQDRPLDLNARFLLLEVAAGLVIIVSFLIPGRAVMTQTIPQHFPWYIFLTGLFLGVGAFGWKLRNSDKR
jgi:hypothetical protein